MAKIDEKKFDITNPESLAELKAAFNEIALFDEHENAYSISNGLNSLIDDEAGFKSANADLYKQYVDIIIKLRWIALALLKEGEVVKLFKENFLKIFEIEDFNLEEKMRFKFLNILVLEERDKLKNEIRKALAENNERISSKKLMSESKMLEPSVASWIFDYNKNLGITPVNKTKQTEYFTRNENAKKASNEEKDKLRVVFNIYEKLKLSSLYAPGLEEYIPIDEPGMKGIIKGSEVEPLRDESKIRADIEWATKLLLDSDIPDFVKDSLRGEEEEKKGKPDIVLIKETVKEKDNKESLAEMFKDFEKYMDGELSQGAIEVGEKLQKESVKDLKVLRSKFYHAVNSSSSKDALGALFAIAENRQIRVAFAKDDRFVKFWGGYLEQNNLDVEHFKNDPANEKHFARFIKYIFENRLGMNEYDSLMSGIAVGNLARVAGELEYQEMVYGDEKEGKFKWNVE
jgi:hypothetical protein